MHTGLLRLPSVIPIGFLYLSVASAAPRPETPADKQDKVVKEFVGRVLGAVGRQDFDTVTDLCEVPFNAQKGRIVASKDNLKAELADRFLGKDKFDGSKHTVLAIQSYKEARPRFNEQEARDAGAVMGDADLVIRVEIFEKRGTSQGRLLIRLKDGKPRLVGIQSERADE